MSGVDTGRDDVGGRILLPGGLPAGAVPRGGGGALKVGAPSITVELIDGFEDGDIAEYLYTTYWEVVNDGLMNGSYNCRKTSTSWGMMHREDRTTDVGDTYELLYMMQDSPPQGGAAIAVGAADNSNYYRGGVRSTDGTNNYVVIDEISGGNLTNSVQSAALSYPIGSIHTISLSILSGIDLEVSVDGQHIVTMSGIALPGSNLGLAGRGSIGGAGFHTRMDDLKQTAG